MPPPPLHVSRPDPPAPPRDPPGAAAAAPARPPEPPPRADTTPPQHPEVSPAPPHSRRGLLLPSRAPGVARLPPPAQAPAPLSPPQAPRVPRAPGLTSSFVFSIRPSWAGAARCLCTLAPGARAAQVPAVGAAAGGAGAARAVQPLRAPGTERDRARPPGHQQHERAAAQARTRPRRARAARGGPTAVSPPPLWVKSFVTGGGRSVPSQGQSAVRAERSKSSRVRQRVEMREGYPGDGSMSSR